MNCQIGDIIQHNMIQMKTLNTAKNVKKLLNEVGSTKETLSVLNVLAIFGCIF